MIDDFEVLQKIAESDHGAVYQAQDRREGRIIALKRFDEPARLLAWEREVRALGAIRGEYVVKLMESGHLEQGAYLALEWLNGESLDARASREPLSVTEFARLTSQALGALHSVHRAGYLHRDVKPANLQQGGDGIWTLIDFGEARPFGEGSRQPLVGSIHCMAPEQFEERHLDERTDLYALGCTLFFALTGRFAHGGDTTPEVITSHLYPEAPRLAQTRPDLPASLIAWVEKLMARLPEDRPQTCQQALENLSA
ncbi:MAG: serine/threonine-protein kinase [Verrucomicrobiota bacterium]